jgi:hypothetical protein
MLPKPGGEAAFIDYGAPFALSPGNTVAFGRDGGLAESGSGYFAACNSILEQELSR